MAENVSNSSVLGSTVEIENIDIILYILYAIIGVIGITGNLLVVFVRSNILRSKATNLFIVHQSFIDFISSFFLIVQNVGPSIVAPSNVFGDILCRLWNSAYPMWASITVSSLNLMALTLERYFAIVYPVRHHLSMTLNKVKIIIAIEWTWGFLNELYWALIQVNQDGVCVPIWPNAVIRGFFGTLVFLIQWLVPITVMVFSYTSIYITLKEQSSQSSNSFSPKVQ